MSMLHPRVERVLGLGPANRPVPRSLVAEGVGVDSGLIMVADRDWFRNTFASYTPPARGSFEYDVIPGEYEADWKIPDICSGSGRLSVTSGKVIVTDPCYLCPDHAEWMKVLNKYDYFRKVPVGTLVLDEMGGDGCYEVGIALRPVTGKVYSAIHPRLDCALALMTAECSDCGNEARTHLCSVCHEPFCEDICIQGHDCAEEEGSMSTAYSAVARGTDYVMVRGIRLTKAEHTAFVRYLNDYKVQDFTKDDVERFLKARYYDSDVGAGYSAITTVARRGQTEVGGSIYCKGEPYEITDIREDKYGEVYTVQKPSGGEYEVRRNLHPLKGSSMGHWTRFRYSCQCVGWRYNRHCKHTQGLAQALGERQSYSAVEAMAEPPAETLARWLPVEGIGLAKTLGLALLGGALVYALVKVKSNS